MTENKKPANDESKNFDIDNIAKQYARAFSRLSHKCLYIIDHQEEKLLYVCNNRQYLSELTADEMMEMGFHYYTALVSPEDIGLLAEIDNARLRFMADVPPEEKENYVLSYNFEIISKRVKKKRLIRYEITPLRLTETGDIRLSLCAISMPAKNCLEQIMMTNEHSGEIWTFDKQSAKWHKMPRPQLTAIEKDILRLSVMGFTTQGVADTLNLAYETVKSYKKEIFRKLHIQSIPQAITNAINQRLL